MKLPNPTLHRILAVFVLGSVVAFDASACAKMRKGSHLAQAARHYEAGEYEKAEIEYKNVLQAEALNQDAIAQLGVIFFDEGRVRQAIPYLTKARELKPDNLEVRRRLALLYVSFGRSKDAIEEARYILEHKPTDDTAPIVLIDASINNPEDLQAARTRLQQLPGGAAEGAPVVVALGLLDLRQKNFDAAESAFKRAATLDPKLASAHAALASLYRAKKDLPGVENELKAAADLSPPRSGKMLQYGQFLLQSGKAAEARKVFEELSKKAPDYLPAYLSLAELAAAEKKYDDAIALVTRVLAVDQQNPEAMLLSGRLSLAKGEPVKAVATLEKALRAYPNSPQALYFLGLAYSATGDKQKAIDQLEQSVKIAPIPDAMVALAQLNLRKGDYSAVIVGLKPLVQQRPDNMQARLLLAEAYRAQGNYEEALVLYRRSEKEFPNNPQAPILSGIALLQQNKLAEARKAFEQALERSPGYVPAVEQLVNLDLREKHPDDAVARVETELKKNADSAGLHFLMARAMLAKSDKARAEVELRRTIEIQPNASEPYFMLAQIYMTAGDQKSAVANLQSAAEKNPKDPKPVVILGMIYEQLGDVTAARTAYEKVLTIDPKSSLALNNLAVLYAEKFSELDKAVEAAQKARDLLPNEPHVADTFGWILYKKGQYARAASLLEESADNLPEQAEIRYHLGVVQYALGDEEAARTSLNRAVELQASAPWVQEAKKKLSVLAIDPGKSNDAAVAELEKLLAANPTDAVVLTRLATIHESRGNVDQAITTYQAAAKANSAAPGPWVNLARLYLNKKDPAKALEAARTARKLASDDPAVAQAVGWLAYQAGDYDWSASLLQDAARKQPDDAELLYRAGLAAYSVGRISEAENLIREALGEHPGSKPVGFFPALNSGNDVAVTKTAFGSEAKARQFLELLELAAKPDVSRLTLVEDVLKQDAANVPALMALGGIQEAKREAGAARASYEKVLTRFGAFSPAKLRLAVLAASASEFDARALEWAQQARTAFPNDAEAARALGILTVRKGGDPTRAITLLRQTLAARPSDAEALYYLGTAQIQNKDQSSGKQSLQKAIDAGLRADLVAEARAAISAK